ncbi:hypothetical protein [Aquimarina intermedia]|uniref:Uncharacterized protein n=1 Tax=Aquimarina intermedia TaxID=350814 RepID=A0A5S5C0Y0_9FLAO|nr:hypothetical protein [Aquimarina intermedia]TYP72944.1 hypothetical protein BD809_106197 [Aquimarina intermedia]
MPKVLFKWLWERLQKKENIHALVKNLAKDGRYYWVITDFEVKTDDKEVIHSFFARRKYPPRSAIKTISDMYNKLLAIEKAQGVEVSEKYFIGFLEERNQTYDEFIEEICLFEKQRSLDLKDLQYHKRKGLFVRMFK